MVSGWPVTVSADGITLRPLRLRDARAWREIRSRNTAWLQPWEATLPPGVGELPPMGFTSMVRRMRREAMEGRGMPWGIEVDGRLVGQLTMGGIAYGSLRSAFIGYWIDEAYAGRGIMPRAVAMACDVAFERLGLHRIEIAIRPENTASRRVVEKLGFREEGLRPSYLHIDGDWRDHLVYVLFAGDQQPSVLEALRRRASSRT